MTVMFERRAFADFGPAHNLANFPAERGLDDDEGGSAPLAGIVEQFGSELKADGLLAAWHGRAREPVALFASGDCTDGPHLEQDLIVAASQLGQGRERHEVQWARVNSGASQLLTAAIASTGGTVTLTARFREADEAMRLRLRETAVRLLRLIHPFFRLWAASSETDLRLRGLTSAVNNSDVATLLVDRQGQLLFANDAAEALISANDGLSRSGSTLRSTRLSDTLRLQATIDHVLSLDPAERAGCVTPVVPLPRERGRPLLAAIVASKTPCHRTNESVATIYIFDPEIDLRARCEPACKLYGLSPVETRLTCLLADGASLSEAAAAMHIREQTARTYLKQIFLKTDTNRQAELVWVMVKSSVRTAPGCRTMLI